MDAGQGDMLPDLGPQTPDMARPQDLGTGDDAGPDQADARRDLGAPDQAPDLAQMNDRELTLHLWPRDWGLEPGSPTGRPQRVTLRPGDRPGHYVAAMTWPAGVWSVGLEAPQEQRRWTLRGQQLVEQLVGLAHQDAALEPELPQEQASPLFSAVDEPVELHVRSQAQSPAQATLSIVRQRPQAAPTPLGQLEPDQGSVGPLFDAAIAQIAAGQRDEFEVVLELLHALREVGAGPVHSSLGRLFIIPGSALEPAPEVRGTFTQWQRDERAVTRRLIGRLFGRFVPLQPGYHEYKLVFNDGAAWFTDLGNRHIAWDGIDTQSVGAFNSTLWPELRPAGQGRMVWWPRVDSTQLNNARQVYVHLPPSYDQAPRTQRYPTLYVHDGNESVVRSQLHQVADAWHDAPAGKAIILVFVALPSQDVRMAEYTMGTPTARGDHYADFIAQTLTARVDAQLRTLASRRGRGLVGASLGGLISYWIAARHPTIFEYTAGMSSSFWWQEGLMIEEQRRLGCQDKVFYLDSGSPADNSESTRQMRDLLTQLGCDAHHVEQPGGRHEWSFWRGRFPAVLDTFHRAYSAP